MKFPKYLMGVFLFISILMIVEFILLQIVVYQRKGNTEAMEKEILLLKAKLYDKGQHQLMPDVPEDHGSNEVEDEKEDE